MFAQLSAPCWGWGGGVLAPSSPFPTLAPNPRVLLLDPGVAPASSSSTAPTWSSALLPRDRLASGWALSPWDPSPSLPGSLGQSLGNSGPCPVLEDHVRDTCVWLLPQNRGLSGREDPAPTPGKPNTRALLGSSASFQPLPAPPCRFPGHWAQEGQSRAEAGWGLE